MHWEAANALEVEIYKQHGIGHSQLPQCLLLNARPTTYYAAVT
jgi:hypothetical protein